MMRRPRERISMAGRATVFAAVGALAGACARGEEPDAYGNVEATSVVVGAEASGPLLSFSAAEGLRLTRGESVGLIDTTQLALQREQLSAQRAGTESRVTEVARQIGVLSVQRDVARRSFERTRRLHAQQAATAQQLDQAERDYRVLGEQLAAARAQRRTVSQEVTATDARAAQTSEQLRKTTIINPVTGTVLATYVTAHELVQAGQPLYKIASLDTMEVRAYLPEPQLARLRIGQRASVSVDAGRRARAVLPGTVTWMASEAEFTPTPIQTRDERADLVYAFKLRVANLGGVLKIGMPADVRFATDSVSSR